MKKFMGVGVALVTPFDSRGEVDYRALSALLEHTSEVDYYVALGTTSESATLNPEEKNSVLQQIVEYAKDKKPVVVGVGGNNTKDVVAGVERANQSGADAILSVVPYYNKPSQEGIYGHYAEVLNAATLPVILYNVPGRTGVNMSADTTLRLAHDFQNKAIGIKEASGNLGQAAYILRDRPDEFLFISGDDNLTLPIIALGGDGVISVSANCFCSKMCSMVHAAMSGEYKLAAELSAELHEATDLLFAEGNPAGAKLALQLKGITDAVVRLPLVAGSGKLKIELEKQIKKYEL